VAEDCDPESSLPAHRHKSTIMMRGRAEKTVLKIVKDTIFRSAFGMKVVPGFLENLEQLIKNNNK
jgi:hypothetical protein